jgi:hypothetical protein
MVTRGYAIQAMMSAAGCAIGNKGTLTGSLTSMSHSNALLASETRPGCMSNG